MASMTENQINLKTLQRVDSSIVEIIDNACQVAIYRYERKLGKWEETDVEGVLFLYKRSRYPHYGFIIVNRMSTTNFIEFITSDMQFQLQSPYLLYKNHLGDIIGSWFYEHNDLQRISKRIQTIILKHHPPPKRQRCASESETQDIFTLLCEAHNEYLKKEEFPETSSRNLNKNTSEEKKFLEKSACVLKVGNNKNNYFQVSPRPKYVSSLSFDSAQAKCAPHSSDSLLKIKEVVLKSSSISIDEDNLLLNQPHACDMLLPQKVTHLSEVREEATHTPLLKCLNWQDSENYDIHLSSIKKTFRSHVEGNAKFMSKIHEAYVSSLKTYFTS